MSRHTLLTTHAVLRWTFLFVLIGTLLLFIPSLNLTFELPKVIFFRTGVWLIYSVAFLNIVLGSGSPDNNCRDSGVALAAPVITKKFRTLATLLLGGIVLYGALLILSTFFSIAPTVALWGSYYRLQGLYTYIHYLLFFAAVLLFLDRKDILFLLKGLMATAIFIALFGIAQRFNPLLSSFWNVDFFLGRIFSTLAQPNLLATFLLMVMPLFGYSLLQCTENKKKLIPATGLLILISALLLTLSRSALLGFFFSTLFFLLVWGGVWHRKRFILALGSFFLLVGIVTPLLANTFPESTFVTSSPILSRLTLVEKNIRSIQSRLLLWPATLDMIKDRPLLGFGPDTFSLTFQKHFPGQLLRYENFNTFADRAHNEILDMSVSSGIPATLVYLFILVVTLVMAVRSRDGHALALSTGILGLFIANQFGFSTTVHWMLLWFFVASILALSSKGRLPVDLNRYFAWLLLFFAVTGLLVQGTLSTRTLLADNSYRHGVDYSHVYPNDSPSDYSDDYAHVYPAMTQAFLHATKLNPYQALYQLELAKAHLSQGSSILDTRYALERFGTLTHYQDFRYFWYTAKSLSQPFSDSIPDIDSLLTADQFYQQAIDFAPNNPRLLLGYGRFLLTIGFKERATEILQQYLSLAPEYWTWRDDLSNKSQYEQDQYRIFYKLNPRFDEIFELLEKAGADLADFH